MMIKERLTACLQQEGYYALSGTSEGLAVCCKDEAGVRRAVCFLNLKEGAVLYKEQYRRFKNDLIRGLKGERDYPVSLLMLFYTDDAEIAKRLVDEEDCFWVLDAGKRRVMAYETGEPGFEALQLPIEDAVFSLPEETAKDKKRRPSGLPWATLSIIAVNLVVFFLMEVVCSAAEYEKWFRKGANYCPAVINQKEYYRLLTSMFLHVGLEHLLNNMLILFYMGSLTERQLGRVRYLLVYFLSGILAGLASIGYNTSIGSAPYCVGASGAIFGLTGAVAVMLARNKGKLEYINGRRMAIMIALSLYNGFVAANVDNAAHVGGLLAGAAAAFVLSCVKKRGAPL